MSDCVKWFLGILSCLAMIVFHTCVAYYKIHLPLWASVLYGVGVLVACILLVVLLNAIANRFSD